MTPPIASTTSRGSPQRRQQPAGEDEKLPLAAWCEHYGGVVKELGPWLIGGGLVLVVAGLLAWTGALSWVGNLPGDIRITTGNTRIYIPFTSMLLISLVLNVLVWSFVWLFHR